MGDVQLVAMRPLRVNGDAVSPPSLVLLWAFLIAGDAAFNSATVEGSCFNEVLTHSVAPGWVFTHGCASFGTMY